MTDFFDSSFLLALTPITLLGAISTIMLLAAKKRFASDDETVVAEINRVLPQTQCAQCGYPGCRPYAEAIAAGEAINRCPPGGTETIKLLGELLGRETAPLDPECGKEPTPHIVTIDESDCIGCTLCIAACPVDAITGAQRFMHTVIEARCTGCDLCIEPCPVDCIDTKPTVIKQPEPVHPTHDQPCINCGLCVTACPRSLQPQLLYRHRTDLAKSLELDLDACIECRLCDTHCPSDIPLTDNFKVTKLLSQIANEASATAAATESHYERRKTRLAARAKKVAAKPNNKDRAQLLAAIKGD